MDDDKGLLEELLDNTVQLVLAMAGVVMAIVGMIAILYLCWFLYDRYIVALWFTYIGMPS